MWLTPQQIVMVVVLLLAYVVVTRLLAAGPRITGIRRSHAAVKHRLAEGRRDFEKERHLVVTPPVGTPVVLIAEDRYLREYHGAEAGKTGTVVQHSRLNSDDAGVLVDWGVRPNDMVRMDLKELRLAPHA